MNTRSNREIEKLKRLKFKYKFLILKIELNAQQKMRTKKLNEIIKSDNKNDKKSFGKKRN